MFVFQYLSSWELCRTWHITCVPLAAGINQYNTLLLILNVFASIYMSKAEGNWVVCVGVFSVQYFSILEVLQDMTHMWLWNRSEAGALIVFIFSSVQYCSIYYPRTIRIVELCSITLILSKLSRT